MWKKIIYSCLAIYLVVSLLVGTYLSHRLGQYMDECRRYREQLDLASDRQREIRTVVNRTGEVLSSTVYSVKELREKLKEVENSYNQLYNLCFDNGDIVHGGEIK